jgi:ABC-2 type transport system permease protein
MNGRPQVALSPGPQRSRPARVRRQLGIVGAYFAQFLKMRLAYRVDFMVDLGANLFAIGVQLATLTVLFSKVPALKGWSFEQVLFIYGFSLVPLGLFNLTAVNLYRFADAFIIEGRFDRVLLRPLNTLAQVMLESFNVSAFNEMGLGLTLMIWAGRKLSLTWGVVDILALAVLATSASLVYLGVFLGLTSVSFWFEDRMGLAPPVYNVIRFSRYPVTIFGSPVRFILTFVLPFAWVAFYPATWFIGSDEFARWAYFTPLVGAVVFGGAVLIWSRGVRNYSSTGS